MMPLFFSYHFIVTQFSETFTTYMYFVCDIVLCEKDGSTVLLSYNFFSPSASFQTFGILFLLCR